MPNDNVLSDAWLYFGAIAALGVFFSFNVRLFVPIFVPRDDLRYTVQHIVRDPNAGFAMRLMAGLQFIVGCIISLAGHRWLG